VGHNGEQNFKEADDRQSRLNAGIMLQSTSRRCQWKDEETVATQVQLPQSGIPVLEHRSTIPLGERAKANRIRNLSGADSNYTGNRQTKPWAFVQAIPMAHGDN
jgi:hypothetical protein